MNKSEFEDYFHESPAKKPMRGDRWLAMWLLLGAIFWGALAWVLS